MAPLGDTGLKGTFISFQHQDLLLGDTRRELDLTAYKQG